MPELEPTPEPLARLILQRALRDGRCGELIDTLSAGGTVRIDERNGKLRIRPRDDADGPASHPGR